MLMHRRSMWLAAALVAALGASAEATGHGKYCAVPGCCAGVPCAPNREVYGYFPTSWRRWPTHVIEESPTEAVPTPAPEQEEPDDTLPELPSMPSEPRGESQPSELVPPFGDSDAPPTPPSNTAPLVPPFGDSPDASPFEDMPSTPSLDDAAPIPPQEDSDLFPPFGAPATPSTEQPSTGQPPMGQPPADQPATDLPGTDLPSPDSGPGGLPDFPLEGAAPSGDTGDPFQDDPDSGGDLFQDEPGASGASIDRAPQMLTDNRQPPRLLPADRLDDAPRVSPVADDEPPQLPQHVDSGPLLETPADTLPNQRANPLRVGSTAPRSPRRTGAAGALRVPREAEPASHVKPIALRRNPLRSQ